MKDRQKKTGSDTRALPSTLFRWQLSHRSQANAPMRNNADGSPYRPTHPCKR